MPPSDPEAHVSPNRRRLQINDKLCEILGYERDEPVKKICQDVTRPEDLDLDLGQVRRVLDGEIETYSIEKRYLRNDGSVTWADLTVSLVRDTVGDPTSLSP